MPENRETDRRHKFWRYSPEINTGHILTVATMCIGAVTAYGTYQADKTQTKADIDAVKITAARDREDMKTAVEGFRADLKELKTEVRTVGENVTVLKATQQRSAK
jgi:hypothetical protein